MVREHSSVSARAEYILAAARRTRDSGCEATIRNVKFDRQWSSVKGGGSDRLLFIHPVFPSPLAVSKRRYTFHFIGVPRRYHAYGDYDENRRALAFVVKSERARHGMGTHWLEERAVEADGQRVERQSRL